MNLTQLLQRAKNGDETARGDVIRIAHEDLRRVARAQLRNQQKNHTLNSTALVHEVAVRLLQKGSVESENRSQFLAYAATAMRRILIDHARTRSAQKRKASGKQLKLSEALIAATEQSDEMLRLDEALDELVEFDRRSAQIVEMRYFGGLSNAEVAAALNISLSTVQREWRTAKAWLLCQIRLGESA